MKKVIAALLLAAVTATLVLVLAGCGRKDGNTVSENVSRAADTVSEKVSEAVTDLSEKVSEMAPKVENGSVATFLKPDSSIGEYSSVLNSAPAGALPATEALGVGIIQSADTSALSSYAADSSASDVISYSAYRSS